jgi:hypothetical protein
MSDFSNVHGDYIESKLYGFEGQEVGKIILTIEVFRRTFKYMEKVVSEVLFEKIKE